VHADKEGRAAAAGAVTPSPLQSTDVARGGSASSATARYGEGREGGVGYDWLVTESTPKTRTNVNTV